MNKHAFLIMAHHRPDLLAELVKAIDDPRNDIFIHLDAKSEIADFHVKTQYSSLYFTKRIPVEWGGYSQIECELLLFEAAFQKGPYDYYHLLTGSTYLLKSNDGIHDFFDENQGKEFIGFDNNNDYSFRSNHYFLFNEIGKPTTIKKKILWKIRNLFLLIQKAVHFNKRAISRNLNKIKIKKGLAYVSVTNSFVSYILQQRALIKALFSNSISGDECFLQTLAYNSNFKDNLYCVRDEYEGNMRTVAWDDLFGTRTGHNFEMCDLEYLLQCDKLFALKFEGPDGMKLISSLKEEIRSNAS